MTHAIGPGLAMATVSSVLYIALGVWVLTLTPRRRQTTLLAAFAIMFGLTFLTLDVLLILHRVTFTGPLFPAINVAFRIPAYLAALGLAASVPEPLEDRRLLYVALGASLGLSLVSAGGFLVAAEIAGFQMTGTAYWLWGALVVVFGILWAAVVLLGLRARPGRGLGPDEVTQLALLTLALAMLDAFVRGLEIPSAARAAAVNSPATMLRIGTGVALWLVVAGLWAWNMIRADDETVDVHRAAMLGILGLLAGGAVAHAARPGLRGATDPVLNLLRGGMRTLGVGLLAYGVLRHDLAGLDAKVEWTVSKTTVAGVFVAVFFIVSEGAQVLFAGVVGSQLLGIVAAGALLFALAPIQRLADRIAEKAVPGGSRDRRERLYRSTVERFLADGEITDDEEQELADLAEEMGLGAGEAMRIRREVEDETDGGDTS